MFNDLKAAWRSLRHAPGFSLVAVLTLAFALGANTAIFSVADAVLFRPLPYAEPDRVYNLQMLDRRTGIQYQLTPYEYLRVIDQYHRGLGPVGMIERGEDIVVLGIDGAEGVVVASATASYFQVLGIRPALGRIFNTLDEGQPGRVAMLSYEGWRRRFGGDESIVGRAIRFGTATFDVVGILPREFVFPLVPFERPEIVTVMEPIPEGAAGGATHSVVRLETGVTREQAQAEIEVLAAPIAARSLENDVTPVLSDVRSVSIRWVSPS